MPTTRPWRAGTIRWRMGHPPREDASSKLQGLAYAGSVGAPARGWPAVGPGCADGGQRLAVHSAPGATIPCPLPPPAAALGALRHGHIGDNALVSIMPHVRARGRLAGAQDWGRWRAGGGERWTAPHKVPPCPPAASTGQGNELIARTETVPGTYRVHPGALRCRRRWVLAVQGCCLLPLLPPPACCCLTSLACLHVRRDAGDAGARALQGRPAWCVPGVQAAATARQALQRQWQLGMPCRPHSSGGHGSKTAGATAEPLLSPCAQAWSRRRTCRAPAAAT